MTLSAAILLDEMPIVISDVLVSGPADDREHIDIPTLKTLEKVLPKEWMTPVTGLARKTYIIGNNLAVSFAGDALAARSILMELQTKIVGPEVTLDEFIHVLQGVEGLGARTANISAAVMSENGPFCIAWHSGNPKDIGMNTWVLSGSGSPYFIELARTSERSVPELENKFEETKMTANGLCAGLIGHEFLSGENLQHRFGGGFEAVYFDGEQFKFVDDYVVCFWEAKRNKDGLLFRSPGIIFRVSYLEELLYIRKYEDLKYDEATDQIKIGAPLHFFIGPMIGNLSSQLLGQIRANPDSLIDGKEVQFYNHVIACKASVLRPGLSDENVFSVTTSERTIDDPKFRIVENLGSVQLQVRDGCFKHFEEILLEQNGAQEKVFDPQDLNP